ncbi:MAG: hypothetical protein WC384_08300 [Prolixibacteraceae bacterium]|jgi:hypothetical protein
MKTTVKQFATGTFLALLLIVVNVKAEGKVVKVSDSKSMETAIQLENWMTDATIWNANSLAYTNFALYKEPALELEDWMSNEEIWKLNYNLAEEADKGMEIESWMTTNEIWNSINNDTDSKLTIEPWMIDEGSWK